VIIVLIVIVVVTASLFYLSLIFAGKARSLPFEWSTVIGSNLVCKC